MAASVRITAKQVADVFNSLSSLSNNDASKYPAIQIHNSLKYLLIQMHNSPYPPKAIPLIQKQYSPHPPQPHSPKKYISPINYQSQPNARKNYHPKPNSPTKKRKKTYHPKPNSNNDNPVPKIRCPYTDYHGNVDFLKNVEFLWNGEVFAAGIIECSLDDDTGILQICAGRLGDKGSGKVCFKLENALNEKDLKLKEITIDDGSGEKKVKLPACTDPNALTFGVDEIGNDIQVLYAHCKITDNLN